MSGKGYNSGNISIIRRLLREQPGMTRQEYAEAAGLSPKQIDSGMGWLYRIGEVRRDPPNGCMGKRIGPRYYLADNEYVKPVNIKRLPHVDGHELSQAWPI